MNEHRMSPGTRMCAGCRMRAYTIENRQERGCRGRYLDLPSGIGVIIQPDERMVITHRGVLLLEIPTQDLLELREFLAPELVA